MRQYEAMMEMQEDCLQEIEAYQGGNTFLHSSKNQI